MYTVYYGKKDNLLVDVTSRLSFFNNLTYLPSGDEERSMKFTDVLPGVLKSLYIQYTDTLVELPAHESSYLEKTTGKLLSTLQVQGTHEKEEQYLKKAHSQLQLRYGSFQDEYPEQLLATKFLTGKETVLEIGGNIGRNSLIIASLLTDSRRMLVLECSVDSVYKLMENRDLNCFHFYVERSALSARRLIQYGWETKELTSQYIEPNWSPVPTITYDQLLAKYNLVFDTLILDCEGAFANILRDYPQILDNVNLILMENDYRDVNDYLYVKTTLEEKKFQCIYHLPLIGHIGFFPHTRDFFYQVWRRS